MSTYAATTSTGYLRSVAITTDTADQALSILSELDRVRFGAHSADFPALAELRQALYVAGFAGSSVAR